MENYGAIYMQMADGELLSLAVESDSLTENARRALWAELHSRGLGEEATRAYQQHLPEQEAGTKTPEKLATILTFNDPLSAQLAKTKLESQGIAVFIANAHLLDIFPVASAAFGRIELQVREADEERARKVLEANEEEQESGLYPPNSSE